MDPRRVLIFRAVAHAGSLAGAARALGWTQPAVSQHVRRLEKDAGMPLVVRAGRGVELTEAGALLLTHAEVIAARLTAAGEELAAMGQLRGGRVHVVAFPSACATVVPAAFARLARDHPGLDLRLTEAEPPEAIAMVDHGEADLGLVFHYPQGAPLPAQLSAQPLMSDPIAIVVRAGHPVAGDGDLGLVDLAGEQWVAGCPRCRSHLVRACRVAGFDPDIRHSTDDYVVAQELVAAGLGVAALPELALRAVTRPRVRAVHAAGLGSRTISSLVRPDLMEVPAVKAALRTLRCSQVTSGLSAGSSATRSAW